MPQVSRNNAARRFYEELGARYPDFDKNWFRQKVNDITAEELKLVKRDLVNLVRTSRYYHVGSVIKPEDVVISLGTVLNHIDKRLEGK